MLTQTESKLTIEIIMAIIYPSSSQSEMMTFLGDELHLRVESREV